VKFNCWWVVLIVRAVMTKSKLCLVAMLFLTVTLFLVSWKYSTKSFLEKKNLKSKPSVAIIVPIRNRPFEEKFIRVYCSHYLSQFQEYSYEIIFAEQIQDDYHFNKGVVYNAAFLSLKNRSDDCYCLQDADTVPLTNELLYRCPKGAVPYHLTPPKLHPHVTYDDSGAGNFVFTSEQFLVVNGFGSNFWGWGKEDDNLVKRFKSKNLWPFEVPTNTSERFVHLDCDLQRTESQAPEDKKQFLLEDLGSYGLNTSVFEMVSFERLDDIPIPISKMSFKLHCNMDLTPWCKK